LRGERRTASWMAAPTLILLFEPSGARSLIEDRWTDEMLDRIEANYEPTGTFALTRVYLPKE
jgi:hypothetical protein